MTQNINTEHQDIFNPTPGTKFLVLIFLGTIVGHPIGEIGNAIVVLVFCVFFALLKKPSTAIKTAIFYSIVLLLTYNRTFDNSNGIVQMYVTFLVAIKLFFLPVIAGKFLIATTDVSSMIASMTKARIPNAFSIPIAIMFRFFPAFKEEKQNIKLAMKMRGITFKNPIKYLEYVTVPLLISSSNLADDIAKAAETKCIADPCKKTRYKEVKFRTVDAVFIFLIGSVVILKMFVFKN